MTQRTKRSEWGADNVKFDDIKKPVKDIFIHHTATKATNDAKRDMKNIESGEQARGYLTTAYLAVIHPDGSVLNGRRSDDGKVHLGAATKNNNSTSHAWCFIGDMRYDEPTEIALENCAQDIAQSIRDGEVDRNYRMRPHSDVVPTACPGDKLRAKIPALDARVKAILGDAAPTPAPTPTPQPKPATKPFVVAPGFPGTVQYGAGLKPKPPSPATRSHQAKLNGRGWHLVVDGRYGNDTKTVVLAFQNEKAAWFKATYGFDMDIDGIAGPQVWTAATYAPIT